MLSIMEAAKQNGGANLNMSELVRLDALLAFYPLHDRECLDELYAGWVTYFAWPWKQPLWEVCLFFNTWYHRPVGETPALLLSNTLTLRTYPDQELLWREDCFVLRVAGALYYMAGGALADGGDCVDTYHGAWCELK